MDPGLLDLISDIRETLGSLRIYEVISGYRSPETNDMLRATGSGFARNSQQLLDTAIELRLEDIPIEDFRDATLSMQRGGVDFYDNPTSCTLTRAVSGAGDPYQSILRQAIDPSLGRQSCVVEAALN